MTNRWLLLALTFLVIVLAPGVRAQEGGPYLKRGEDSRVSIKREGWARWVTLETLYRPLGRDDSVRVDAGSSVRLYREDHFLMLEPGRRYRVGDALRQDQGVLVRIGRFGVNAVRTLAALVVQQPTSTVRTTHEFVERGEYEPPALLFTAEAPLWPVAAEAPDLVWLPSSSAADTTIRVRVFEGSGADCAGGRLALDTLVTGNVLPSVAHAVAWTDGTRYRVELADPYGGFADGRLYDAGCFALATSEKRAALKAQIAELRSDLEGGAEVVTPDGESNEELVQDGSGFDTATHVAALLIHEGYYYDAFLVLDGVLERAPDDPGIRTLWAALAAKTGVFSPPEDAPEGADNGGGR